MSNQFSRNSTQQYEKYKDSGIAWIGEIPEHWEVRKLKKLTTQIIDGTHNTPIYTDTGIPFLRVTDISSLSDNKDICFDNVAKISEKEHTELIKRCYPQKGDLLVSKNGSIGIPKIITWDTPCSIFVSLCLIKVNKRIFVKNLYYYFKSSLIWNEIAIHGKTGTITNLHLDKIREFLVPVPPLSEQEQIADYLDKKCALIDESIEKNKTSIEKLKEYKQAIITEAVTKGLNKSAPLKNSNIEWIGQIPEHWEIRAFKYIMNERNEKNFPIKTSERLSLSIDKGITLYNEKTTNLDRFKDDVSQYKLAYEGDLVFNSMNMIVGAIGYSKFFGCISPAYYTFFDKTQKHYTSKYYEYVFLSKTIRKVLFCLGKGIMAIERGDDKVNTCRLKVSRDDLRSLKLPLPPAEEQQHIAAYLDKKCAEIDTAIQGKETLIEKLTEYKKSLIFECVTGKRKVAVC